MSFLRRLANAFTRRVPFVKVIRAEDLLTSGQADVLERSRFTDFSSYLLAGTRKIWATYRACDIVAKAVLDTPHKLVRPGRNTAVEVPGLAELFERPNEQDRFSDLLYLAVFHLKLTGNAYWAKDQADGAGNKPKRLFALNPKNVRLVVDPRRGVLGYEYRVRGQTIPFDAAEVIHFRFPHPNRDFYGLGEIEAGEDLFNDFLFRQSSQSSFWKNGATPSGVFICEDVESDREAWELMKARWNKEYAGQAGTGKVAWLAGKWKYEQIGLSATEMQNIEASTKSVEDIFVMHGVPLSVAGVKEAANFATAQVDMRRFKVWTVKPTLRVITDALQQGLVRGFDERAELRFELTGLSDLEQVASQWAALFDRGVVSVNEMREFAGLPRVEDDPLFDGHFVSAGLVPLDLSGTADLGRTDDAARDVVRRFLDGSPARRDGE